MNVSWISLFYTEMRGAHSHRYTCMSICMCVCVRVCVYGRVRVLFLRHMNKYIQLPKPSPAQESSSCQKGLNKTPLLFVCYFLQAGVFLKSQPKNLDAWTINKLNNTINNNDNNNAKRQVMFQLPSTEQIHITILYFSLLWPILIDQWYLSLYDV